MQANLLAGRLRKHFPVHVHSWKLSLSSSELTSERLPAQLLLSMAIQAEVVQQCTTLLAGARMGTDW